MAEKVKKGKFIVFEGLDGAGQDTQIPLIKKYLEGRGKKVYTTSEPSHNLIGGLIRSLLRAQWKLSNTGIQLLYCADRAHHLESEVLPALESGMHVVCGRYRFSTIAFGALDNDRKWLEALNEKFPDPDITIFLKVSPKECIRRISSSRLNKELFEKEKKLQKVYKTYLQLVTDRKYKNVHVIDGDRSIEEVTESIAAVIDKHLK